MTRSRVNQLGEGMIFSDPAEVHRAYDAKQVHLQALIKVRIDDVEMDEDGNTTPLTHVVDTTVGRAMLYDIRGRRFGAPPYRQVLLRGRVGEWCVA